MACKVFGISITKCLLVFIWLFTFVSKTSRALAVLLVLMITENMSTAKIESVTGKEYLAILIRTRSLEECCAEQKRN